MKLTSQTIEYAAGDTPLKGYLVWDEDIEGARPGIIVVHEWWGLNDYIRRRADMLAEMGYCVLAVDMFGNGMQAENPDQAGEAMNAVLNDMDAGTARLQAGLNTLLAQPQVEGSNTAAIGYCFGGAMVLHMARIGMPLSCVASFHGALGSFHQPGPGEVKAEVLVCHGGGDAMVSMDDVSAFKQEMDNADANYEVIVHEGAPHGFTSTEADENGRKYGIPVGYDASADRDSWAAMQSLFQRSFN